MSFLAHLLGRDRPEAVQPRLPSLFEPPPSAAVFGDLSVAPARTDEERPAPPMEAPMAAPRRRAPVSPPPPAAVTPREEPAEPPPPAPRRRAVPPPEPVRPEPALFPRPESGPDRTVVAVPLPVIERPALPAPPAPSPRALAPITPVEPPRAEAAVRIETREIRTEKETDRPAPPAPVTPPPSPAPVLARPEIAGIAPRQEPPAERFAVPEPAPVIRVTIGRIEVRAVPSAASATVAAAPAETRRGPEPSLEEYLKRRSGAGRD